MLGDWTLRLVLLGRSAELVGRATALTDALQPKLQGGGGAATARSGDSSRVRPLRPGGPVAQGPALRLSAPGRLGLLTGSQLSLLPRVGLGLLPRLRFCFLTGACFGRLARARFGFLAGAYFRFLASACFGFLASARFGLLASAGFGFLASACFGFATRLRLSLLPGLSLGLLAGSGLWQSASFEEDEAAPSGRRVLDVFATASTPSPSTYLDLSLYSRPSLGSNYQRV